MRPTLRGTTALAGAGLAGLGWSAAAVAESPITLGVGGFFRAAYMVVLDDDDSGPENFDPEPGDEHSDDGFFNDAEVHFVGRTVLDNGLEVGARIELEGETDEDQIDEAWVYFAGGFGEIRIGSDDDALANSCILPPGGTANFSAFSPNQWGANALGSPFGVVSNSACSGVDNRSDAQKILYFSPVLHGFQFAASYTPDPDSETHVDGAGPHVGMTGKQIGDADFDASFYLTYFYAGRGWDVTLGAGGSFEGDIVDSEGLFLDTRFEEQDFYQAGFVLNIERFAIGGVFEYYNDLQGFAFDFNGDIDRQTLDAWVAGGGIAYYLGAWTLGAQYSYREDTFKVLDSPFATKRDQVQQRAVATVNYALGPGINLDGEIAYTWRDVDPETLFETDDDYDAVEFGIGTAITF